MAMEQQPDVIVVGGGNAALTAAISAREHGASVLMVEKAPIEDRGGNTGSTGIYRFAYNGLDDIRALIPQMTDEEVESIDVGEYPTDQLYNDMMRLSGGRADPAFCETMVNNSYDTVKWMVGLGVKWEIGTNLGRFVDGKMRFQVGMPSRPAGRGPEVLRTLFRVAEEKGIEVRYETKATRLLVDEAGKVCGVRIKDKNGFRDVKSKAVVLACGGFQANPEMRTRYLGAGWDLVKVRGTRYDTGDGLQMALDIGAASTGQFSNAHATQVFAVGPDFQMEDYAFPDGYTCAILVNMLGKRFVDEGEDFNMYTYAKLGQELLKQPRHTGFQIFDFKVTRLNLMQHAEHYRTAKGISADSIEELARKIDVDEEALAKSIAQYNEACPDGPMSAQEFEDAVGSGYYNPSIRDGKETEGIEPAKTNWASRIDTPPFTAFPVVCGITFTYGGLKADTRAQVLDTEGDVIPGLYASGEVVGSFYFNYAAGFGLVKGAVFGRIAGRNAATD